MQRRLPAAAAALMSAILIVLAHPAAQSPGAPPARPVFVDGQAQIVPAFQDSTTWIREKLWVEAEFDSDRDGRPDRVFVDVTRPRQTETENLKVPVIYESSPYYAGTSGNRQFLWNVKQEVGAEPPPRASQPAIAFRAERESISNSHVATWLPRGFAVVHSDAPGTGRSQGCVTVGSDPEQLAPKAVIDWLNGRAKGFRTIDGNEAVTASWSTGKVGMTGTSYNGTLPLAAAVTGVRGLEAIIPIAPNTSYYHYYRSNGLVRHPGGWLGEDIDFLYDFVNSGDPARREHCNRLYRDGEFARGRDRASGDYNDFWRARDLLTKVKNIRAAVFMAHAFNDWNVVPEHSVRIYQALKGKVPLRAYFHQGGHGGAPPLEMMNKWFTRYLYGVENGVEREPKAWIVRETAPPGAESTPPPPAAEGTGRGRGRAPTPPPVPYDDYPNPAAKHVTFHLMAGGGRAGGLSLDGTRGQGRETLVDNVEFAGPALAAAEVSKHRLLYATPELPAPVHISGIPRVTIRLASNKPAANLSVWLIILPWTNSPIGPANLITRGWADPQNHRSLREGGNYDSPARGEPLVPGRFYDLTFDLQPDDQIIPAGKRIGLMIFSSDRDFTLWPSPGTELTVDLDNTSLRLPVVGGAAAVGSGAQDKPASQTPAARPGRTEAEARARAETHRREREQQRSKTGTPSELIPDYVKANIGPVPESLGVSPFYTKYADALGIPVIASEKVPDAALLVARDIVNTMLAARPDIRKALIARGWRTGVIAEVEMTMDIPEYSKMKRPGAPKDEPVTQADRDYHANRSRGLGGNPTTGAEENLLGYPGTRYWGEHIFVHEFAHAIMGGGIRTVDPAMFAEIRAAYDAAMAAGKYEHADGRKHYATTSAGEYWAEGVQWWFFSNYGECFAGNVKVETPEEFAAYDPVLNELISRVFTTHRIPMDVFHGKRIRPVVCPAS